MKNGILPLSWVLLLAGLLIQPINCLSTQELAFTDMANAWPGAGWNASDASNACSIYGSAWICNSDGSLIGISLSGTMLKGTIPDSIGSLTNLTSIGLAGCGLYGEIPNSIANLTHAVTLNIGVNNLTGPIPDVWDSLTSLTNLLLNQNSLSGTLPASVSSLYKTASFLNVSFNQLTGLLPTSLNSWGLGAALYLQGNHFEICDGGIQIQCGSVLADVSDQTVGPFVTSNLSCAADWTGFCTYSDITVVYPPPSVVAIPPAFPQQPSQAPPITPTSPPIACSGSPPSNSFNCTDGIWTATGSVSAPSLTISGATTVNGNLDISSNTSTSPAVLTVTSLSSTTGGGRPALAISECLVDSSTGGTLQLVVDLSNSDVNSIYSQANHQQEFALLSQGGTNCSIDFTTIPIKFKQSSSCKQVKLVNQSTSSQLNVLFTVDNLQCDVWWIVLVSVVGALLLIFIIVFLIAYTKIPALKAKLNPFWVRSNAVSPTM